MLFFNALLAAGLAAVCSAQSVFTPLRPPSIPLAVKSPYMSTWQQAGSLGGNGGYLPGQWPTFWYGAQTGWTGYIRVDNITYIWMGDPEVSDYKSYYVVQTGFEYSSTQSTFTLDVAGVVGMTVNFVSPVLPNTILEMSLPYTYMDVSIHSIDGKAHDVQLYTDISAEWVAGDRNATAEWSYGVINENPQPSSYPPPPAPSVPAPAAPTVYGTKTEYTLNPAPTHEPSPVHAHGQGNHPSGVTSPPSGANRNSKNKPIVNGKTGGVAYHKVWRQTQLEFTEYNQQAEWGYWYYATDNTKQLTYQQGRNTTVWSNFVNNGFLPNTANDNFRPIEKNQPVFGFAVDMGVIHKQTESTLFQISLNQQNCILFESAPGNVSVPCMWTNYFGTDEAAVEYFYNDYANILSECNALDNQVQTDAVAAVGDDYYSITALAVRQAFGALEFTNSPTQPWVFLKEISSDGDIQTVDVIFPFHPIAVYMNATILKYMLDPLFINQEAGYWPYAFSIHDLGYFPNATGYNNGLDEMQPLEECGNMIIMTLAYAQRTGDNAYLAEHYDLLLQWNNYLVNDSLIPAGQLSTDDFLGFIANETNLALKGIIGIEAMAQIANRTGHTEDGANFTKIAHSYIEQWENLGFNFGAVPPHEESQYGNKTTYELLYNLFSDAELGLDLVPKKIYKIQSDFYPTVFDQYGAPLLNNMTGTKVDWEMFTAAVAETDTQNQFVSLIAKWLDETDTNFAFTDFYNCVNGSFDQVFFINRPVVGGMFSILALNSAPTTGTVPPTPLIGS